MSETKNKGGRPKAPEGHAKAHIVPVRFKAGDREAIAVAAQANGQTVSEWIRVTLLRAAKRAVRQ